MASGGTHMIPDEENYGKDETNNPSFSIGEQLTFDVKDSPNAMIAKDMHININKDSFSPLDSVKDKTKENLDQFNRKLFFKTRAAQKAHEHIINNFLIWIEGGDVSGKTSIGLFLLRRLTKDNFIPVILDRPEEFSYLSNNEHYVILIDDIFGVRKFSQQLVTQWSKTLEQILKRVHRGDYYLVLTSKVGFLDKSLSSLSEDKYFGKDFRIILDDQRFSLRTHEKFKILEKLVAYKRIDKDTELLAEIANFDNQLWFLHCCKYLTKKSKPIHLWSEFFRNPVEILHQKVHILQTAEPMQLAVLFLIMRDGKLSDQCHENVVWLKTELMKQLGLNGTNNPADLIPTAISMVGTFLKLENGNFIFLHDVVKNAVCFKFWEIDINDSICWFPVEFLVEHATIDTVNSNSLSRIQIRRGLFPELKARFIELQNNELLKQKYLKHEDFCKLYLQVHNDPINVGVLSEILMTSALNNFSTLLSTCLEVWSKWNWSTKEKVEHVIYQTVCKQGKISSAKRLLGAGFTACIPHSCDVCSSTNQDLPSSLLPFANVTKEPQNDIFFYIVKGLVFSGYLNLVNDFFKKLDPETTKTVGFTGLPIACEAGNTEMYIAFKKAAGDCIDDYSHLIAAAIKCGDIQFLSKLMHDAGDNNIFLNHSCFLLACSFNKKEVTNLIWDNTFQSDRDTWLTERGQEETAMQKAIKSDDSKNTDLLEWLVSAGFSVNERSKFGQTALHSACICGHRKAVTFLLKNGACVSQQDDDRNTALHLQCISESLDMDIVEQLLDSKADVCAANKEGKTPLHLLCENQHKIRSMVMHILIQRKCKVNCVDLSGQTPLHRLLDKGFCLEELEVLIESKASTFIADNQLETPLHTVCRTRNCDALKMMLGSHHRLEEVDINLASCLHHAVTVTDNEDIIRYCSKRQNVNVTDIFENSPLHSVMLTPNNNQAVEILMDHGANSLLRNCEGQTPFHIACQLSNGDCLCFIKMLSKFKGTLLTMKVATPPLHLACKSDGVSAHSVVELLLDWKADINGLDFNKRTPLHIVCETSSHSSLKIAQELCSRGADLDCVDNKGNTPLTLACKSKGGCKDEVISFLINQGANVLQENSLGESPIMIVNEEGHSSLACHMLDIILAQACQSSEKYTLQDVEKILKVDWSTKYGKSNPLLLRVCRMRGENIASVLEKVLDCGIDVNSSDEDGMTAVHSACSNIDSHTESVLSILRKKGCSMSAVDSQNRTAMHFAVDNDDERVQNVLDSLLEWGLGVNDADINGNTPLHLACGSSRSNSRQLIHWLIQHDACLDYLNNNGETCSVIAEKQKSSFVKETLMNEALVNYCLKTEEFDDALLKDYLESGADINCTDTDGNTLFHMIVVRPGNTQVAVSNIKIVKSLGGDLRIRNRANQTAYEIALFSDEHEQNEDLLLLLFTEESPENTKDDDSACASGQAQNVDEDSTLVGIIQGAGKVFIAGYAVYKITKEIVKTAIQNAEEKEDNSINDIDNDLEDDKKL